MASACVSVCFADVWALIQQKSISSVWLGDSAESSKPSASEFSVHMCLTDSSAEKVSPLSFHCFCPWWKMEKPHHLSKPKNSHNFRTCPSKEAAVSSGMFTFRDGCRHCFQATFSRGGRGEVVYTVVCECTGAWLNPSRGFLGR